MQAEKCHFVILSFCKSGSGKAIPPESDSAPPASAIHVAAVTPATSVRDYGTGSFDFEASRVKAEVIFDASSSAKVPPSSTFRIAAGDRVRNCRRSSTTETL